MSDPWTTADIPDQSGRVAVVTGANSGLGFETARALARSGARVVMACRSLDSARTAAARVRDAAGDDTVDVRELDLASLDSVEAFADGFDEAYDRLDLLVNNAGVMHLPFRRTADGFETQFGVNHLGHFALTGRLLPALLDGPESRVVTVSSGLHRRGEIDFENLNAEEGYDRYDAYSRSKLANLLFTYELARRLDDASAGVKSVAAHPGYAATNLQFAGPRMEGSRLRAAAMAVANRVLAQDPAQGALPQLYAATAADVENGDFIGPDGLMEMRGSPTRVDPAPRARNRNTAKRLWERSVELTGVEYPFPTVAETV